MYEKKVIFYVFLFNLQILFVTLHTKIFPQFYINISTYIFNIPIRLIYYYNLIRKKLCDYYLSLNSFSAHTVHKKSPTVYICIYSHIIEQSFDYGVPPYQRLQRIYTM